MKKMILIVDDDPELLEETSELLTGHGFDTKTFSDSRKVMKAAREIVPDAILLDLNMPYKDGFMLAAELTRSPRTRKIPIIGMTGFYRGRMYANLMNVCGFHACLHKPIDPKKLISVIERETGVKSGNG